VEAGTVVVHVTDTGIGLAEAHLEKVFEPFVQVSGAVSSDDGVGLGLSISRDLARGMGGDIVVRSELGVGSTFTVRLPAAR
jgi:signal transduction histidine kinase